MHSGLIFPHRLASVDAHVDGRRKASGVKNVPFAQADLEATAEGDLPEVFPGKYMRIICRLPVPQTDTGIRDEYSKARELNLSKELGKIALYLR